ncbi:formylaminopyrimidine-binding protein [Antarctobacter heliothermus]|uniref:Thiamine pyrimidine synthase n=1 Tax=Antarctobacter heliothermus TaxID=74033 RepID=A0A222E330_9RHOB|nr:ABC transporter substrate-binding protein [Antarctobacter heliothermus]ASP20398.1 formylaminopyrimidine-binding protein [Antarctobacter heliothermus]
MIRKNHGYVRAAVSALALTIGFATTAGAQEQLTVRLDFSPWGVHAGMHLAQQRGWFEEAGLNVEVQDGRGSGNTLQLVNAGQVDVGQVQLGLLAAAREEGAKVTSFAGFQRKTDLCILVDKDSETTEIADLKGKSLVVFAASPWASFVNDFIAAGGLEEGDVEILFVDPAALWGTYTAGRADGLMSTIGSAIPVAEASRPSKCLMLDLAELYFPSYGLIASEDVIAERSDELAKLVEVQQRAWAEIKENPQAGVDAILAMRQDAKLNPEVLREQIQLTVDYFDTPATEGKPIGWQSEEDWAQALAGMEKIGLIASGWTATDYFTSDLVE